MRSAYEIRSLSSSKWCVRSAAVTLLQCTLSGFVRATQAFLKRTKKFLASGDNTLQYSEAKTVVENQRAQRAVREAARVNGENGEVLQSHPCHLVESENDSVVRQSFYRHQHSSEPLFKTLRPLGFNDSSLETVSMPLCATQRTHCEEPEAVCLRNLFEHVCRLQEHGFYMEPTLMRTNDQVR